MRLLIFHITLLFLFLSLSTQTHAQTNCDKQQSLLPLSKESLQAKIENYQKTAKLLHRQFEAVIKQTTQVNQCLSQLVTGQKQQDSLEQHLQMRLIESYFQILEMLIKQRTLIEGQQIYNDIGRLQCAVQLQQLALNAYKAQYKVDEPQTMEQIIDQQKQYSELLWKKTRLKQQLDLKLMEFEQYLQKNNALFFPDKEEEHNPELYYEEKKFYRA